MAACKQLQREKLADLCRLRPWTYGELQRLGISTSPHRRLAEAEKYLPKGERLVRMKNREGLVTFRIVKVKGECGAL